MENKIINISVNDIEPHPNNPRKDVGDISELKESIKRDGIRQNLTVIPYEAGYRCLIGHRRLAAAKLASLEQVPCVIEKSDMSLKDQIGIMLAENMQRVDLTPIEEAESMQMMLDLGDTVESISEKTGLSKSTVYRRINPLKEYGADKVTKAFERGATFSDFEKLNVISDPEKRQEVADKIGTNNFNFAYENACREEENKKKRQPLIEKLNTFAEEITSNVSYNNYKYIQSIYNGKFDTFEKPDDADMVKYFYSIRPYGIELYREYTPEELEAREQSQKERIARDEDFKRAAEARSRFVQINETVYNLRKNFVKECNPLKGCNLQQAQLAVYRQLCGFFVSAFIKGYCEDGWCSNDNFIDNIGMETTEEFDEMDFDEQTETVINHVCKSKNWEIKSLFAMLMAIVDSSDLVYNDWYGQYKPSSCLDFVYEVLCAFGYEMSDEEKQLQDGSHELFVKE